MKNSLLIAFALWMLLAPFIFRSVSRSSHKSLSEHIAMTKLTIWVGRITICLIALVVAAWYFGWYATLHSNMFQAVLLTGICAAAIVLAIFPYYADTRSGHLHSFSAWSYALLLLPLGTTFIITSSSNLGKFIIALLLLWQVIVFCLFLFYNPSRKYFLYYQLSYIGAFGVLLMVVNYVGD